ncbi:hypothetical protein BKM31_34015 [[Actinomadura] parvosata subsp. kistnae]|uniref:HTH gntR-type domain-containing protein n=1 Tax=[Actinomadura] parvosata subsp. kistnae TaxID=1909395 RepID=A0A1V0AKU9_9ACTN|nr:hypothetical protein BKM31_34015 [Nonomuraea sp. ATCC 55076]
MDVSAYDRSVLDRESPRSLFEQVADVIRDQIVRGELRAGDLVPSEATLQRTHRISRTTARRAIGVLRSQGLVHTITAEGTYVGPPGTPRSSRRLFKYQRVAADIVARIMGGEIPPREAIPGENSLMRQYGVARETVRHALAYLRESGWVVTVAYGGTYVVDREEWPINKGSYFPFR